MKAVNENDFRELIEAKQFNGYTLVSGEDWQIPTAHEILLVRGLIPLTDIQLANRLDVDALSANGKPDRPGWCSPPGAVCAGWPDWGCRWITISAVKETLPEAFKNESSLVSPA